jgi:pimeloyl-ACP methyl ester carboxylesterase
MSITKNEIKVGSLDWFYRETNPETNDKIPVVFLHGLVSQSYSWLVILDELEKQGYKAIAPDWIGSGYSGKPDKRDFNYTPDAFIQGLGEFLKQLKIEKFYLVVQGFLGSMGLQYALRYPEQIEKLIILNTPISTSVKLPWKLQQMALPFVGDMITQDPLLVDRTLEVGSKYVIEDKVLEVYRSPFLKASAAGRSLLATLKNLRLKDAMIEIESGFKNWHRPTQIIWGLIDPWLNFTDVETFAKGISDIEIITLEKAGHYPQEHWPQEISQALILFLRKKVV